MSATSQHNGRLAAQLDDARACLADLARRGVQILGLQLGRYRVPLIEISRPPRGIQGGTVRIQGGPGRRIQTMAAHHMDCQIEWRIEA